MARERMLARAASTLGHDIGETSHRWNFDYLPDKDTLITRKNDTTLAGNESDFQAIKSGILSTSSKTAFGWRSWQKRWFVLTTKSLMFFKNDHSLPGGGEINQILGGIILKNSGRVTVREEKRLLTLVFPDVAPFTFKAETSEDLRDWRAKLEYALRHAPI